MATSDPPIRQTVAARLARAGCVAAEEEADELIAAARAGRGSLDRLVERRAAGDPLAWVTGEVLFAGHKVRVDDGVYVPRWQTEVLAYRAVAVLPPGGVAADLCTGSGAVAVVLARSRPDAHVVATDVDPVACRCAASNGVEVRCGDLAGPLLPALAGRCDLVTAVPPYVPTDELRFLPRDARDHEPRQALDGGPGGTSVLRAVVAAAGVLLGDGGTLLVELGGEQDQALAETLRTAGFRRRRRVEDGDGDLRMLEVVRGAAGRPHAP